MLDNISGGTGNKMAAVHIASPPQLVGHVKTEALAGDTTAQCNTEKIPAAALAGFRIIEKSGADRDGGFMLGQRYHIFTANTHMRGGIDAALRFGPAVDGVEGIALAVGQGVAILMGAINIQVQGEAV